MLGTTLKTPTFRTVHACPASVVVKASEYLSNVAWIDSLAAVVKDVNPVIVTDEWKTNANELVSAMETRLDLHIAKRVDIGRWEYGTLRFVHDNLPAMIVAMCMSGHVVPPVGWNQLDERRLVLPRKDGVCHLVTGHLLGLKGCDLYFDPQTYTWIQSGKTSGEGRDARVEGRGKTRPSNATGKDQMRIHRLYSEHPASGVTTLGATESGRESLRRECGTAYDTSSDTSPWRSDGEVDSLFVWSKSRMDEPQNKEGDGKTLPLGVMGGRGSTFARKGRDRRNKGHGMATMVP